MAIPTMATTNTDTVLKGSHRRPTPAALPARRIHPSGFTNLHDVLFGNPRQTHPPNQRPSGSTTLSARRLASRNKRCGAGKPNGRGRNARSLKSGGHEAPRIDHWPRSRRQTEAVCSACGRRMAEPDPLYSNPYDAQAAFPDQFLAHVEAAHPLPPTN